MTGALALLSGILLGLLSAALPDAAWLLVAGASAMLALGTRLRNFATVRHLAWLLAGMVFASASTLRWLTYCVPAPSADSRVLLEGVIRGVPARDGVELRFDLDAVIVEGQPRDAHSRRVRVVWRDTPVAPRTGERWRLLVRLAPLADAHNFSGPDTARFAFRDGVHFAGRVLPSTLNARLALANTSVDTLRARVAARVGESVADPDAAALLTALAVGLTDRMSADQWRVFNATGTTHLVAISGLHVTMFALAGVHGGALRMALAAFRKVCRTRTLRNVVRPRRRGRLCAAVRILGAGAAHLADARAVRCGPAGGTACRRCAATGRSP